MKLLYSILFRIINMLPIKLRYQYKVTFFLSFSGNLDLVNQAIQRFGAKNVQVLFSSEVTDLESIDAKIRFSNFDIFKIVAAMHSGTIFIFDNYYPFLETTKKDSKQRFIQIWHANGAIKSFGWEDPNTVRRSKRDQKRFQSVYDSFDYITVGSKAMATVFKDSWHVTEQKIVQLGYPRSDRFYDQEWQKRTLEKIKQIQPDLLKKQLIFYAPTYRKDVSFVLPDDWNSLTIPTSMSLIIRLHPHLKSLEKEIIAKTTNALAVDPRITTDELLFISNILITDYSSVIFDFAINRKLNKSAYLFTYDLESYTENVGIQSTFLNQYHAYLIKSTSDLSELVLKDNSSGFLDSVNKEWNTYNDGLATERLLDLVATLIDNSKL